MNVGVFSGSFNPIHIGHLILGDYITEFTDIDEVWFLVSPHNPLKNSEELLDEAQRLKMVTLALEDYPKLKASDFEFSLPKPSYTVATLEALREQFSDHNFSLVIGADNWETFEKWRDYSKILENHKVLVYPRLGHRLSIASKLKNRVEALDSPVIEISSTFIRENIAGGCEMRALMPPKVYEYVKENSLYK